MSYLRTFAPWIAFAVIPSQQWQWAALVALLLSVVEIARQTKAGRKWDALIIDIGTALFFTALTALAFADPDTALHDYTPALSSGVLAVIAGVSLAVRRPFTLAIAKNSAPRELWEHPGFIRTAYVITSVWTASFAVGAIALTFLAHSGTPRTIAQVAAFVVPIVFTIRYVAHLQSKAKSAGIATS
ncbi:hypothetical protein [Nocardia sp. NPDC052566]|uniref:hypothetical protein n=1 Tax=Nocardia sp. NPDC052566 TaxID=3364330 RepID=UPI0037CB1DEF